jgi:hypothetical protein
MGLRTVSSSPCRFRVGCRAVNAMIVVIVIAATTATGRQRAESSRPVGNSNGVNTNARVSVGIQICCWYQTAKAAPGHEPGRVTYAYAAYSIASPPVAASRPMAAKIQPTALPGRWATIAAPTTMNAAKAGSRVICWKWPLTTNNGITTAKQAMKIASMDQATETAGRPLARSTAVWSTPPPRLTCRTPPTRAYGDDRPGNVTNNQAGVTPLRTPCGRLPTRLGSPWTDLTHRPS